MKRTRLHALDPEQARKRIKAAKPNKPFMTALLDRDHRGHEDAVDQWTRLHKAAFREPVQSQPDSALQGTKRRLLIDSNTSTASTSTEGRTNDSSELAAQSLQDSLEHGTNTSNARTIDNRRFNRNTHFRRPLGKSVKQAGGTIEEKDDWSENWFAKGMHFYDRISPPVCAASECNLEDVVAALNENGVHPNQSVSFTPGEDYIGDVDLPGPFGRDDVSTTAIFSDGVQVGVRNETLENHRLHSGVVERTVVLKDGSYRIRTQGGGHGRLGGPNIWFDDAVWGPVDSRVIDLFR